jgi:hypothetical protein
MADLSVSSVAKRIIRYLNDRDRNQHGSWVSVADVRAALGIELDVARAACLTLHERGLAELMGGFPLRPTTDRFTLVRLSERGQGLATDPVQIDAALGTNGPAGP